MKERGGEREIQGGGGGDRESRGKGDEVRRPDV